MTLGNEIVAHSKYVIHHSLQLGNSEGNYFGKLFSTRSCLMSVRLGDTVSITVEDIRAQEVT